MAKNWKVGEAVQAIQSGSTEDKLDIGRRFPLFTILAAQANQPAIELLSTLPDYVTARKLESVLKGDAQTDDGEGGEEEGNVPAAAAKPETKKEEKKEPASKTTAKANEDVLAGKSPKELFGMCKELGIKVEPKQPSEIYIKALKKHAADEAKKAAKATPAKDDEWEEEKETAGKGAKAAAKEDDEWDI